MRSLFSSAPFTRFDLGAHALSQAVTGGAPQTAFSLTDYLDKVGLDAGDIDKVQDPKVRAEFKADYEKCKTKGLDSLEGIACLGVLAVKVYAKLKEEGEKPPPPMPVVATQKASSFPWIPVAIGGVAAAGLIVYLATKGK
jgi:hypothetical protein